MNIPGMTVRAKKRAPSWAPTLDETEALAYAQDTNFNNLIGQVATDPAGRGPVPALGPYQAHVAQPGPSPYDTPEFNARLDRDTASYDAAVNDYKAQRRPGGPAEEIESGAVSPLPEPLATRVHEPALGPQPNTSPTAMMTGGQPWSRSGGWNVNIGEAQIKPKGQPAPEQLAAEDYPVQPEPPSITTGQAPAPVQTPPQGRHVTAPPKASVDAGPAPEGQADTFLRALPAAAAYFIEGAGQNRYKPGVQERLDRYTAGNVSLAQGADAKRDAYGRRKAALNRAAEREFAQGQQAAEKTNYGRDRDALLDSRDAEKTQYERGRDTVTDQRWQAANSPEAQARARAQEMEDKKALTTFGTDENIRQARELARMRRGAGGAGRGNVQQAYQGALDALGQKYGGVDKIPPMERQQLDLAAQSKDAIGALRQVTGQYVARDASEQKTTSAAQTKAQEAVKGMDATDAELARMEQILQDRIAKKSVYLPGMEPLATGATIKRGAARLFGGGSATGSTGFTKEEADLNSGSQLAARGEYYDITHNSANLKPEMEAADSRYKSNGTNQGALEAVRRARQKIAAAKAAGKVRLDTGEIVDLNSPSTGAQPVRAQTKDGEVIELVD